PESTVLNGSSALRPGFSAASVGTRSRQYIIWLYIGCSTHSVPSWSKVAMRSSGGTKFGFARSVVDRTKSRIACFAGPSFHEASSFAGACAREAVARKAGRASRGRAHWGGRKRGQTREQDATVDV